MKLVRILLLISLSIPFSAQAQNESDELRRQLEEQRALNREQSERIEAQQKQIDDVTRRLEEMESASAGEGESHSAEDVGPSKDESAARTADRDARDGVGDLNHDAVVAGEFPGSIRIPGTGDVSLALGGMVKVAVIGDTSAEAQGADFLPATLGTVRPDRGGAVSLDATLTRLFVDGRAPLPSGKLRGYVEFDINRRNDGSPDFKLRHAFGSWENRYGTLVAGHTWSTMMDLKILPESVTEPTVSGVMFTRQAQLRWSQPLGPRFTAHVAIENPDSNDVFTEAPSLNFTTAPDTSLGIEYDSGGVWHVRLNSIVRFLNVDLPDGSIGEETAWGLAATGHLDLFDADKLVFSGVYGRGLGRYLLGIQPTSGAAITPTGDELRLRENWGGMMSYKHRWVEGLRSYAMLGYAKSQSLSVQAGETFESSIYGAVNLLWSIQPFLTIGIEYDYGRRENRDDSSLDNHRVMFGIQIF